MKDFKQTGHQRVRQPTTYPSIGPRDAGPLGLVIFCQRVAETPLDSWQNTRARRVLLLRCQSPTAECEKGDRHDVLPAPEVEGAQQ